MQTGQIKVHNESIQIDYNGFAKYTLLYRAYKDTKMCNERHEELLRIINKLEKITRRLKGECSFVDCKDQATFEGYCDFHRRVYQERKRIGSKHNGRKHEKSNSTEYV